MDTLANDLEHYKVPFAILLLIARKYLRVIKLSLIVCRVL